VFFAERDRETLEPPPRRGPHPPAPPVRAPAVVQGVVGRRRRRRAGRVFARLPDGLAELREHEPRARRTGADLLDRVFANL
jgi:hypothetical protein